MVSETRICSMCFRGLEMSWQDDEIGEFAA
jgi:hypothetical protein